MEPALPHRLHHDLVTAMKARDAVRVSVLRSAMSAISNAEAVEVDQSGPWRAGRATEVARHELTEDDLQAVLRRELQELRSAEHDLRTAGRASAADELAARAEILRTYVS